MVESKEEERSNEIDCSTTAIILKDAIPAVKPEKENYKNMPFSFPAYLDAQEISLTESIVVFPTSRVEYVSSTTRYNTFQIVPEKVAADPRTTCMIRNIPNKYTARMMLEFINETHAGKYDFFYLRIDFRNRCNVGYAFINFIDRSSVLSFYRRINGKKWPFFSSKKVAELTYASLQGIDNLRKRFRKSSVMDQDPEFRPLFFCRNVLQNRMNVDREKSKKKESGSR